MKNAAAEVRSTTFVRFSGIGPQPIPGVGSGLFRGSKETGMTIFGPGKTIRTSSGTNSIKRLSRTNVWHRMVGSVIIWVDYFLNIWPFTAMEIRPIP